MRNPEAGDRAIQRRYSARALLFALTLFLSAAMLFVVQLMLGKMVLPIFGGVPAVWNTCMVFFQAALLAGYAYAHASVTCLGARRQAVLHVAVLCAPLLILPISINPEWAPAGDANPVAPLLGLLFVSVGLPFFVIATSAPLLQRWFAEGAGGSTDPYPLYASSNAGSMLGLLAYPVFIEPYLVLRVQSLWWTAGYGLFVLLSIGCAATFWLLPHSSVPKRSSKTRHRNEPAPMQAPDRGTRRRWLAYSFVPSSLLLGVTTYLTSEMAPIPLLWVIPLTLYLLSFILVFGGSSPRMHRLMVWALGPWLLLETVLLLSEPTEMSVPFLVLLLTFFVVAMVCHGELGRSRPRAQYLTEFYLWISAGGVLGGLFNALVAPFVFSSVIEYPLVLVFAALLMPALFVAPRSTALAWLNRLTPLVLATCMGVILLRHGYLSEIRQGLVHRQRSFFSVLKVIRGPQGITQTLVHGSTRHGTQIRTADPRQRRLPLLYYFPTGPIGQVFQEFRGANAKRQVAIVGLGIGALAGYGEAGHEFAFFEIDPAIEEIARNPDYFTCLTDAEARGVKLRVELGDARISLRREPAGQFGLMVLDAFSGDAVPTHLLTEEAVRLYLSKLTADGLLAFHVTSSYLDLKPVLAAQAQAAGLLALVQDDAELSEEETRRGKAPSTWIIMARQDKDFGGLSRNSRWRSLAPKPEFPLWTDDYSNIFQVLIWRGAQPIPSRSP
jgi:hypothetical protein